MSHEDRVTHYGDVPPGFPLAQQQPLVHLDSGPRGLNDPLCGAPTLGNRCVSEINDVTCLDCIREHDALTQDEDEAELRSLTERISAAYETDLLGLAVVVQPSPERRWSARVNPLSGLPSHAVDLLHGGEHEDSISAAEARLLARFLLLMADRAEEQER